MHKDKTESNTEEKRANHRPATFISPNGSNPSGKYQIQVKHISELNNKMYKGHRLVGISMLKKLDQT